MISTRLFPRKLLGRKGEKAELCLPPLRRLRQGDQRIRIQWLVRHCFDLSLSGRDVVNEQSDAHL
jgi:hypothetical protein